MGYILCNLITELDAEREHLSNVDNIKINNYDRVTSHKDMCMRRAPTYQHHFLTQAQLITQCAGPRELVIMIDLNSNNTMTKEPFEIT